MPASWRRRLGSMSLAIGFRLVYQAFKLKRQAIHHRQQNHPGAVRGRERRDKARRSLYKAGKQRIIAPPLFPFFPLSLTTSSPILSVPMPSAFLHLPVSPPQVQSTAAPESLYLVTYILQLLRRPLERSAALSIRPFLPIFSVIPVISTSWYFFTGLSTRGAEMEKR